MADFKVLQVVVSPRVFDLVRMLAGNEGKTVSRYLGEVLGTHLEGQKVGPVDELDGLGEN